MMPSEKKTKIPQWLNLYIFSLLSNTLFDRALWIIYLISIGISCKEVGFLESLLHLSIFFLEIPTGILADVYGHKNSLIFSRICVILYAILMISSNKLYILILPFFFMGLSEALVSGSEVALLYNLTKRVYSHNIDNIFLKVNSEYSFLAHMGVGLGIFLGGFLLNISWRFLYVILIIVQCISILSLFSLETTERNSSNEKEKSNFNGNLYEVLSKTKSTFKNIEFCTLVIGVVFFTSTINAIYIFIPLWFNKTGFSTIEISMIFTLDTVLGALILYIMKKLSMKIEIKKWIFLPSIISMLGLISFVYVDNHISSIVFLIISGTFVLFEPLSDSLTNSMIEKENRATVLSVISFVNSFLMMGFFVLAGYIFEKMQSNYFFLLFSVFILISIIFLGLFFMIQCRKEIQSECIKAME